MAFMSASNNAMTIAAPVAVIAKFEADQGSSSLEIPKRQHRPIEAQIGQVPKDEDVKTQLEQLRSEKEAAVKELNRMKEKLAEAEANVSELQMYKAITECTRPFGTQLLPKIPNEITLDHICTKLPWSAVRSLSSVNRFWREAIQRRRVYDVRVHTESTENLVCITRTPRYVWREVWCEDVFEEMTHMGFPAMNVLYPLTENSYYELPPIPNLDTNSDYVSAGGLPACCQCVSLDGKIYVLGGTDNPNIFVDDDDDRKGSAEVYVLDVARQRPWKQVASMQEARMDFAACVMDGKIYAFGGRSVNKPVHGSEVYDPKVDKWSPIMPMKSLRFRHKVAVHGEELWVSQGEYYDRLNEVNDEVPTYDKETADDGEVYYPATNMWRVTEHLDVLNEETPTFTAKRKGFVMDRKAFYSLDDVYEYPWTNRQDESPLPSCVLDPCAAVAINGEVVAITKYYYDLPECILEDDETDLLQSIGFDKEDNGMVLHDEERRVRWRTLPCSIPFKGMSLCSAMLLIQL